MKSNKNRHIAHYAPHSVKGFTLIEFLVASMLAMIVIVAAGSTYMITRKLNSSVQERISVQQDIRNASVQLARDARMAGSFGCFNTGDNKVTGKVTGYKIEAQDAKAKGDVFVDAGEKDGFGVRLIKSTDLAGLGLAGLNVTGASDALLFIYGQSATAVSVNNLIERRDYDSGSSSTITSLSRVFIKDDSDALKRVLNEKKGDVILSTCGAIKRIEGVNNFSDSSNVVDIKPTELRASKDHQGELSISKLHASLYVLGDVNRAGTQWKDEKALLRYDLGADGSWQNPQLLASGIQSMSFAFGYVNSDTNSCKNEITSATNSETFTFVDDPNSSDGGKPPALVQIRLKYYANKATGKDSDADVRDYIINTTVRAGNTCANRLVTS